MSRSKRRGAPRRRGLPRNKPATPVAASPVTKRVTVIHAGYCASLRRRYAPCDCAVTIIENTTGGTQ